MLNAWNRTDLTFEYCIKLFAQVEAAKREKIPVETARQWFIEFLRRGWDKKMLSERYKALMGTKIYGIEKLEIADWINAVPVMAMDEVNIIIKQKIDKMIQKGRFLKDKKIELTEEEKQEVDLAIAKEIELEYNSRWYEARETYAEKRRRELREKRHAG